MVVQERLKWIHENRDSYKNWLEIFGTEMSLYRFEESKIPNVNNLRRPFGYDRVQNQINRLTFIRRVKIPIAFDDLIQMHTDPGITSTFTLPEEILVANDLLIMDYLDNTIEFLVISSAKASVETYFEYQIKSRSGQH